MKKSQKNTVLLAPARSSEHKFILHSMVASFRIEGIFIPETKARAIYEKVAGKLKK